ncbi:MAG: DUF4402 domain-containing protein [Sphingomonas sp.]|nr:DUF4402 domain-containing protein [Sphingomonas sp.]
MGDLRILALAFAASTAAVVGLSPARGQCRLCEKPRTALSQATDGVGIELEIETSLDFGRLILAGQGQGAAVIRPDGSNAAEGALAGVGPRAMVGSAVVHGSPGRAVRVELPHRIDLFSLHGGRITVDNVTSDLSSLPRLDSAGNLTFRFGGRVTVTGDSEGDYRGDMPITVEYQ